MSDEQLKHLVETLLTKLGVESTVVVETQDINYKIQIDSPDSALLIGHGGETLQALQSIIRLLAYQIGLGEARIMVDINGYRSQKEDDLRQFVRDVAARVRESGVAETLRPMTSYERRLAHEVVGEAEGVVSESTGEGEGRRITIKPA